MSKLSESLHYYFPIWYYLTVKNITNYTRGSLFGVFWTLLFPFFQMFILLAIFSSIFNTSRLELFYSIAPAWFSWNFFIKTTSSLTNSLDTSSVKMTSVPNILFPLSRLLDDISTFLIGFIFIIGFHLFFNHKIPVYFIFNGFFFIFLFLFFIAGIGLILSSLQVFFKDTSYIWGLVCHTGMFVTPVFLPESFFIESKFWFILKYNPLFYLFKFFKDPLLNSSSFNSSLFMWTVFLSLSSLCLGVLFFNKTNKKFVNYL